MNTLPTNKKQTHTHKYDMRWSWTLNNLSLVIGSNEPSVYVFHYSKLSLIELLTSIVDSAINKTCFELLT